jgi:hypothetical protein
LLVRLLFRANRQEYKYKRVYILLSVEVGKTDPRIRLFSDPHMRGAVYTLENIPPNLIEIISRLDLDEMGNVVREEEI